MKVYLEESEVYKIVKGQRFNFKCFDFFHLLDTLKNGIYVPYYYEMPCAEMPAILYIENNLGSYIGIITKIKNANYLGISCGIHVTFELCDKQVLEIEI